MSAPAATKSPGAHSTGSDSPVTSERSRADLPARTMPSPAARSPRRKSRRSPTRSSLASISSSRPARRTSARWGASASRARRSRWARAAARLSSPSASENRKARTAASASSPRATAPTAASVISVSTPSRPLSDRLIARGANVAAPTTIAAPSRPAASACVCAGASCADSFPPASRAPLVRGAASVRALLLSRAAAGARCSTPTAPRLGAFPLAAPLPAPRTARQRSRKRLWRPPASSAEDRGPSADDDLLASLGGVASSPWSWCAPPRGAPRRPWSART